MNKKIDRQYAYPDDLTAPKEGSYRLRIYEGDGRMPVALVTDPAQQESNMQWISGHAPHLAGATVREHLPSSETVNWIARYAGQTGVDAELYECNEFGVIGDHEVVYRQGPRPSGSPPMQPQASIISRADVEAIIGGPLD